MSSTSKRFQALDLLRGFFIVIIIIDHLSRWPSLLSIFTGKALLWVTAAEGFVIISGLLIGYIRGYKAKAEALKSVSLKLIRRALTLYLWAIIGSVVYTAAIWYIPLAGGAPGMPIETGDWSALFIDSITLSYTFLWVYFLKLYAIFLAVSPIAIWLLRTGRAWVVVAASFLLLLIGSIGGEEVLQWQFVFFMPVVAGYYLPSIQNWWQQLTTKQRHGLSGLIISVTFITITFSVISTFLPGISTILDRTTLNVFTKDSMNLMRATTAFIWFIGYLLVFMYLSKYIEKWFGWLLRTIGTHSLTAYILHGAVIILISFFTVASENIFVNTGLGIIAVLVVWALLKVPGVNRVIPR